MSNVLPFTISAILQMIRLTIDIISTSADKAYQDRLHSTRDKMNLKLSRVNSNTNIDHNNDEFLKQDPTSDMNDCSIETELVGENVDVKKRSYIAIFLKVEVLLICFILVFLVILLAIRSKDDFASIASLCCAIITIILSLILHRRDPMRAVKYTIFQRILNVASFIFMFVGVITPKTNQSSEISNIQYILLVLSALLLLQIAVSAILLPRLVQNEYPHQTLSRKAFMIMMKPYFWPDGTSTQSAIVSRVRVLMTWNCVIATKICSLITPLFLGKASMDLAEGNYTACIKNVIIYSIITFVGTLFKEGQSLFYMRVAQVAFIQLAETSFDHLHSLSLDWHLRKKLGMVTRSMDRGISACDTLMRALFMTLIPVLGESIAVCIIFYVYFDYLPLSLSVFFFIFTYCVSTVLITAWRRKFRIQMRESDNDWSALCTDSLINFETVKYFSAESYEKRRVRDAVEKYQKGSIDVTSSMSVLNTTQQFILQACLATSLILTALSIRDRLDCCVNEAGCATGDFQCCSEAKCDDMQIGDFVTVLAYIQNVFAPLNSLRMVYNQMIMATVDLTSLSELLAEEPDVSDEVDPIDLPMMNNDDPSTVVEFKDVHFHYPTQSSSSGLRGLSFKMKKGSTTAIVGPTGAGKTTIARLLFRFYDTINGSVNVNGIDIRKVRQRSLRKIIGVVPQAAVMFNDTIEANIMYGRRDASSEDIVQVAKDSQLFDFISSLADGWKTLVGDRGLKLSGGEKQRAAIARCLLKDPPIVILDEATSSLDTITESSVQQALDRLGKERTCLVIAHRLGTIRNADNIIVLRDGRVHEEGTHNELLALKGLYAELWSKQLHTNTSGQDIDQEQEDISSIMNRNRSFQIK